MQRKISHTRQSGHPNHSLGSLHDRIIGALPDVPWLTGGSLLDHRWVVCLEDPEKKRNSKHVLHFDPVIAPGKCLTDPDFELDLITVKLCAYWSITGSEAKFRTGAPVPIFVRNLVQFVRWRISRGIPRNADLTEAWIEELFAAIRSQGILGLLPLEVRATDYANSIRSGTVAPPTYRKGKRVHFDFEAASKALGIENGRQLPSQARTELIALAKELGYPLQPYQRRSLGFSPSADEEPLGSAENSSDGRLTWGRVATFLSPLQYMYEIRGRLSHDPIGCDPFPHQRNPGAIAKAIAKEDSGRTMTVPPLQACTLIEQALRWVLDYADDIKDYVERLRRLIQTEEIQEHWRPYEAAANVLNKSFAKKAVDAPVGSPWPIRLAYFPGAKSVSEFDSLRPSLRTVLFEYLAVACVIVVAAFSARRREELLSLRDGCISWEHGEPWLETWIEKTILDLDKIPVPVSVARAVEVLEWLSEMRRERAGTRWLLEFDEVVELGKIDGGPRFDIYRSLERFARFVKIPPFQDGSEWTPLPHQFRRLFSCLYYHHWRYPHLTALSNFLRHFDPDQTRRYITEAARGSFLRREEEKRVARTAQEKQSRLFAQQRLEDFNEEGKAFRLERLRNVALGIERASGFGGEVLTRELRKLIDEAKLKLDLSPQEDLPENTLDSIVMRFVEGKRLEPNPVGHSYCKCTGDYQDLRAAECLNVREEIIDKNSLFSAPDPAFAADEVCSVCPHNVQFPENETYWIETIRHEKQQKSCALGLLASLMSERRLEMAEQHYARCFGSTASSGSSAGD